MPSPDAEKRRGYGRAYYERNKQQVLERNARNCQRNRDHVQAIRKSGCCVDCGYDDWRALDFDHVRGTKTAGVSQMVVSSRSLAAIDEEIAKCDLVCANCHRIRTSER